MPMERIEVSNRRLLNQQVTRPKFQSAQALVAWMGAIQAQDYGMAKWALGMRLSGFTQALVEKALDAGEILRAHLLRPTWHLVASRDIRWLLQLTAPHVQARLRSRQKELGLTPEILNRSRKIIEKALAAGDHLTRAELVRAFQRGKLKADGQRAAHLLVAAELDGLICSGRKKGKEQTFALLEERALRVRRISREEALARLALRYFTSHGPATLRDFVWWSGLPVGEAKRGIVLAGSSLRSFAGGKAVYWYSPSEGGKIPESSVHLIPAYDEFIISYQDRSPSLSGGLQKEVISSNGIFRPVLVVNGQVAGLWKRTVKKQAIRIQADFFSPPTREVLKQLQERVLEYGRFLGQAVEMERDGKV